MKPKDIAIISRLLKKHKEVRLLLTPGRGYADNEQRIRIVRRDTCYWDLTYYYGKLPGLFWTKLAKHRTCGESCFIENVEMNFEKIEPRTILREMRVYDKETQRSLVAIFAGGKFISRKTGRALAKPPEEARVIR